MPRPPSTTPAQTPTAAWFRLYRAYRAGRGPKPPTLNAYLRRAEHPVADRHELHAMSLQARAEAEWSDLADAVMREGGLRGSDLVPQPVHRPKGRTPDLMVELLRLSGREDYRDGDHLLADLWARYERLRDARADAALFRRARLAR